MPSPAANYMRMPTCTAVIACCLLLVAACAGPAGAAWHRLGDLSLGFDPQTGDLIGLRLANGHSLLAGGQPDAEIHCEPPAHNGAGGQLQAVAASAQGITVRRRAGEWEIAAHYQAEGRLLRRRVAFTWCGRQPVKVTGTVLRLAGVDCSDSRRACYLLPGDYPVRRHPFSALQPGRRVREGAGIWAATGLVVVHSSSRRLGLVAGYRLVADGCDLQVEEGEGRLGVVHHFHTLARVAPGETIESGEQVLIATRGGWSACLGALGELSNRLDNGPPADRPAWVQRAALYSCHPGGPIETGFRGAGGLRHLAGRLPALAEMGITALWLNPVHEPPPWVYTVHDYRAIAPEVGTREEFARFVTQAHDLGLKVLMDLVPHGPAEGSPAALEAGDTAWTYREDGSRALAWGSLAADHASPTWQRYMADIAGYWVGGFAVDGFRVDCAPGNEPNWRRDDGRRPSISSPLGGEELLAAVRARMRPLNPQAVLFPEAWAPIWFRYGDLVYDYSFYQVMRRLATGAPLPQWVREVRAWLQVQRLTVPAAARGGLVRFVENHDTVRAVELFGPGPSQALTALCIFAQGTPLIYQDQEIGFSEDLGRWLRLRRDTPALHAGEADYQAVRCSQPGVLAFLRRSSHDAAVVAISLLPHDTRATLRWPEELARAFPYAREAQTGSRLAVGNGATISLPAWQPVVILLSRVGQAERPGRLAGPVCEGSQPSGDTVSPRITRTPTASGITYQLDIGRASWWFITGGDGCLLDRFADRHTAEPSPRYDFLWRPLTSALWDAPGPCSLGVVDAQGRLVQVTDIKLARLLDARLQDPSGRGEQVSLVLAGVGEDQPFTVRTCPDGLAALATLRRLPAPRRQPTSPQVQVDPFQVRVDTGRLQLVFLRRQGGLLGEVAVRQGKAWRRLPLPGANLYTDYGLFPQGQVVSAALETGPRIELQHSPGAAELTFRGLLRGPSWNSVQRGWPAQPLTPYRLNYRVEGDSVRLDMAITPPADRAQVRAFLAYVLPLGDAEGWFARTREGPISTSTHDGLQGRVFESKLAPLDEAHPNLGAKLPGLEIMATLSPACRPQNLFLHADGRNLGLYLAALDGVPVNLAAGRELAAEVTLTFRAR